MTHIQSMSSGTRILTLPSRRLSPGLRGRLYEAQLEAGRLWSDVVAWHQSIRETGGKWPGRGDIHLQTKGRYALHSQTIQQVSYRLLANIAATAKRRREDPGSGSWLKYPHKPKRFYPLYWPAQAVCYEPKARRLVLPMGRGRKSLVFTGIDLDEIEAASGAIGIHWAGDGYEIHVTVPRPAAAPDPEATEMATVDLGQIHTATVVSSRGKALVMSGRGVRSIKRHRNKELGKIQRKQSRALKGSRRWKALQAAKNRVKAASKRQLRDLAHKAARAVVTWLQEEKVGAVFIGDPHGVRDRNCGRRHNQRMSQWDYGRDRRYIEEKAESVGIRCFSGDERGTSSHCPVCNARRKPRGRQWRCSQCGFEGHRDVVGAVNMFPRAFGRKVTIPRRQDVTYLRPGPLRRASQAVVAPDMGPDRSLAPCPRGFHSPPAFGPPEGEDLSSPDCGARKRRPSGQVRQTEETPRL